MDYDIFLACAPKDYMKLPYCIQSIVDHVEGYSDIIICSPTEIPYEIAEKVSVNTLMIKDEEGLPGCHRERWKFRPNWCFQQHLKMFQMHTKDWWATIDCDTIINRPFKFFEGDKPIAWKGWDQHYEPYFRFQNKMIGLPRVETRTFIADMNLFYRPIIEDMLERNKYDRDSFIMKSHTITNKDCVIGEPELYGSFYSTYYPDMYESRDLKQKDGGGRVQKNKDVNVWDANEVEAVIQRNRNEDYDVISMHSWLDEGDQNG